MKKISTLIFLIAVLTACNNEEQSEKTDQELIENKNEEAKNELKEANKKFQPIDSNEALIVTALKAAPKESRDGCKVIGYNMEGEFVTLKEGNNEFICIADNPNQEGFSVACYHKSLEPFMKRGRALKAAGKNGSELFEIREEEIKSGELEMAEAGATLHVYYGPEKKYNPETGEAPRATYRYVVYLPFATSESTGLPESPIASNHPWIMDPGTHKAHIMIKPLANQ